MPPDMADPIYIYIYIYMLGIDRMIEEPFAESTGHTTRTRMIPAHPLSLAHQGYAQAPNAV